MDGHYYVNCMIRREYYLFNNIRQICYINTIFDYSKFLVLKFEIRFAVLFYV